MLNGESTYLNDKSTAKGVFSLAALEGVGILVVFCVLALDTSKIPDSIT